MKTILLHSMFRAGSTFIFNKFRADNAWPYYEPLHHDLSRLEPDSIDIWKFTKKATDAMSHPTLNKPHFHEYKRAFHDQIKLPHFDTSFGYDNYSSPPQDLFLYIENLISSAPSNLLPVLQFNRSTLRLWWFKKHFPDALHIFLLRNPIDQFQSYLNRGAIGSNIFLSLNLLIYFNNKQLFPDLLIKHEFTPVKDVYSNIKNLTNLSKSISIIEHFDLFLHIWFLSLIQARKHASLIIDMDKMGRSEDYRTHISKSLSNYDSNINITFNDYSMKRHLSHTISNDRANHSIDFISDYYLSRLNLKHEDFTSYYLNYYLNSNNTKGSNFRFLNFFKHS